MNLCTDQLAMLLAEPGQLVSVSFLAADETSSLMSEATAGLAINHGLAEEIFRLEPDLVVAGKYTTRATVNLLKRLGERVEEFDPARNFDDIAERTLRMGELLGRRQAAQRAVAEMERELRAQSDGLPEAGRQTLGSYGSNSFTSGKNTLENAIVKKSGVRHLGEEIGVAGTIRLPLETLIIADPDRLLIWNRFAALKSRSVEILSHPALDARFGPERRLSADSRYWLCGTPLTVGAITRLKAAARGKEIDP
ncbi:MAG: ABC transporter substrate-binding protein [Pseudomonadota bacterium]